MCLISCTCATSSCMVLAARSGSFLVYPCGIRHPSSTGGARLGCGAVTLTSLHPSCNWTRRRTPLEAVSMPARLAQVRAARNLPIKLLAAEYDRILRRRLPRVGGSPEDGALKEMLACFKCAPRRRGAGAAMPAAAQRAEPHAAITAERPLLSVTCEPHCLSALRAGL